MWQGKKENRSVKLSTVNNRKTFFKIRSMRYNQQMLCFACDDEISIGMFSSRKKKSIVDSRSSGTKNRPQRHMQLILKTVFECTSRNSSERTLRSNVVEELLTIISNVPVTSIDDSWWNAAIEWVEDNHVFFQKKRQEHIRIANFSLKILLNN